MTRSFNQKTAIEIIDRLGAVLVFPINNKKEPQSLWYAFFPKSEMVWEWDEDGDTRVADLWHLRTELSTTRKAVYVKWYQGRATYLSRKLFTALLRAMNPEPPVERSLSPMARKILEILYAESPVSTKELKRMAELKGKDNEAAFTRAMKELWSRLLIVAFGEVDDGAFPSLAVGATQVLFEDLWKQAFEMESPAALQEIAEILPVKSPFMAFFVRLRGQVAGTARVAKNPVKAKKSAKTKAGRESRLETDVVTFEDLTRRGRG